MTVEHRVVGPPGTGKTTWLASQVQRAAEKYGREAVMVASLTRTAAQEVAGRDTGIPKNAVGTLHSHAFHALDRPAIAESSAGVKVWNEWCTGRNPQLRLNDRYNLDPENAPVEGMPVATDGERLLAEIGVLRARMTPREMWPSGPKGFIEEWERFKKDTGLWDFTDLIEVAIADVDQAPGEPQVVFLDEAQDMSRLEMTLARKWGESCDQLVVVGDPWQNLFEWRGSEPEAFDSTPAATERVLAQSYRVPRAVHAYAVDWAQQIVPEGKTFPEYRPRDAEGEVRRSEARWRDPETLMREVLADLERFPAADDQGHPTVMIMASCGYMLDPIVGALRAEGIPFHNPYRPTQGAWNPMRGADRLLSFLRPDPETWGDEQRMWTWLDVDKWTDPMKAQGVLARGVKAQVKQRRGSTRHRFTAEVQDELTLDEAMALVESEHVEGVLGPDPEWWLANLLATRRRQFDYPAQVMRRRGRAALRERPRVAVGTIHSFKGAQADSVYVFPDVSRQGYWQGWMNTVGRPATVRMFYVAFTRARERLTLCQESGPEYVPLPMPPSSQRPQGQ